MQIYTSQMTEAVVKLDSQQLQLIKNGEGQ